jgi:hypothetical protein
VANLDWLSLTLIATKGSMIMRPIFLTGSVSVSAALSTDIYMFASLVFVVA